MGLGFELRAYACKAGTPLLEPHMHFLRKCKMWLKVG
jgi:hypothetical protein